MVLRLRDVYTGEVYGWNRDMATYSYLEEFDDEDSEQKWKGPRLDEPVKHVGFPRFDGAVGNNKDDVLQAAIARAAEKTKAQLDTLKLPTDDELANMSEEQLAAEIERLDKLSTKKSK